MDQLLAPYIFGPHEHNAARYYRTSMEFWKRTKQASGGGGFASSKRKSAPSGALWVLPLYKTLIIWAAKEWCRPYKS
jgi:hypothetical protein